MNRSPQDERALAQLVARYACDQLSPDEIRDLETRLSADSQALEDFVDYMELHARLGWELRAREEAGLHGAGDEARVAAGPPTPSIELQAPRLLVHPFDWRRHPLRFGLLVVSLTLLMWVGWAVVFSPFKAGNPVALPDRSRPASVARLINATDVVWAPGAPAPRRGAALYPGQFVQLRAGLAEIQFARGARILVEGPASLRLETTNAGYLLEGALIARVPSAAAGFVIATPAAQLIDQGTVFGVEVEERTSTVQVFEGAVLVRAADQPPHPLRAGEVVRVTAKQGVTPRDRVAALDRLHASFHPRANDARPRTDEVVQDHLRLLTDAVEPGDGWILGGRAHWNQHGFGKLTPSFTAGSHAIGMAAGDFESAEKAFPHVLKAGDYALTLDLGNFANTGFPRLNVEWLAGEASLRDRMVGVRRPTPPLGGWQQWTFCFSIESGDERLGRPLAIRVEKAAGHGNCAVDHLNLYFRPLASAAEEAKP